MDLIRPYRKTYQLNQVEQWKLQRHPLEVAEAVISHYAPKGPDAIAEIPGEQERLKWVGLYPQRQGGDAFMLRIKVPAGRLTAAQARQVGLIAQEFARGTHPHPVFADGYADLTTRQDIQLHWIPIGAVPEIWSRLEAVGLTTIQACGDSARNVIACPVSGLDAEEVLDATPVAKAISAFFTGNRQYANLPRKFKISVTGCVEDCARAEINDVALWPARLEDQTVGFNVVVGGGLSDGPRMASDIDAFVEPSQAVELIRAVAQVFGELGNRENRGLSRMRYLVQELGPEQFRAELAKRAAFALSPAGEGLTRGYRGDHVGVHAQKQRGYSYVGVSVTVGRIGGEDLVEAARLAELYGDGELRLATDQNFILSGVADSKLDYLLEEPLLRRHSPFPGPFERGVLACTGSEFCRFAIVETKARAAELARYLDNELAESPTSSQRSSPGAEIIRLHFSGCSASCAQPQIADIGLRGETAHVGNSIVEAVDIGLGGSLGTDARFSDWVEGALPIHELKDALVRLVRRHRFEMSPGEQFHEWVRRTPVQELRKTIRGHDNPERIDTIDISDT